jgi:hypothetical protein
MRKAFGPENRISAGIFRTESIIFSIERRVLNSQSWLSDRRVSGGRDAHFSQRFQRAASGDDLVERG